MSVSFLAPRVLPIDHPQLAGNWYPFPPPDKGFYNLRRIKRKDGDAAMVPFKSNLGSEPKIVQVYQGDFECEYYANKRMHLQGNEKSGKFMVMGRRVSKLSFQDGWQFQFLPSRVHYRPFVVLYGLGLDGKLRPEKKIDITGQLPIALSIEEARYIVRIIPYRWPVFWKQHVEYTEEQVQ